MLQWLSAYSNTFSILNIFRYITFRSAGAFISAFFIVFFMCPWFIKHMKAMQKGGQPIRDDGPESHIISKKGTPTMGGVLIIFAFLFSSFLWTDISNPYVWPIFFVTIGMGTIGCIDDFLKLNMRSSKGLSAKLKFWSQICVSTITIFWVTNIMPQEHSMSVMIPFMKETFLYLGWVFIIFSVLVIVGSSNAVNLTDGLDGLALGPLMVSFAVFSIISYATGNVIFAKYLHVFYIPNSGEVCVLCSAVIGACLGFLWYNAHPAMIIMGDIGSLALGGMLGTIGVIVKHELILAMVGGIFVIEAASVMLQVVYFKSTGGRRIFLMAPIHHHFEKRGWSETTVVMRFWIVAVLLGMLSLLTLKVR